VFASGHTMYQNEQPERRYSLLPLCKIRGKMDKRLAAFKELLDIMDDLREKCPWDRKQTLESLRHLTIEETYELADAILDNDLDEIKNELGDLMLHIVFYARIGREKGAFDIADVLDNINRKLVNRHPHIYGDVKVDNAEQVKENWEKIKLREGRKKVLSGVPVSLPAMIKAYRIQDKARGVGFDWEHPEQVWDKVMEELGELKAEVEGGGDHSRVEQEFGDLLFALINYSRFIHVNPESALERTNKKFIRRFEHLEKGARDAGKDMKKMNLDEMDHFWNEAKGLE
jgi:XTP/dITP diphosphohydrolase